MYDNYVQYQTNPEFEGQLSSLLDSKSTKRSSVHRYFAIKFNVFLLFPFESITIFKRNRNIQRHILYHILKSYI